jgi:hypothetical protein
MNSINCEIAVLFTNSKPESDQVEEDGDKDGDKDGDEGGDEDA